MRFVVLTTKQSSAAKGKANSTNYTYTADGMGGRTLLICMNAKEKHAKTLYSQIIAVNLHLEFNH